MNNETLKQLRNCNRKLGFAYGVSATLILNLIGLFIYMYFTY